MVCVCVCVSGPCAVSLCQQTSPSPDCVDNDGYVMFNKTSSLTLMQLNEIQS